MLVGFAGCKGSGKDTAASFLLEEGGWTKIGFADQLKRAVAALWDIPLYEVDELKNSPAYVELNTDWQDNYPLKPWYRYSWREFLQRFGTEMGRDVFGRNFWVDQWWTQYLAEPDSVVVPDVRFTNEAVRIKELGGYIIEIVRPGHEPDGHASEQPLHPDLLDMRIFNDGTIEDFKTRVLATVEACKAGVTNAA